MSVQKDQQALRHNETNPHSLLFGESAKKQILRVAQDDKQWLGIM